MPVPATTVKSARKNLKSLVREVNGDTVAVEIVGDQGNAVLISLARYTALREATFLLRSPELMDSLRREAARSLSPPAPGDDSADSEPAASAEPVVTTPPPEAKSRTRKKNKRKKKRAHRR
ncbi:type II toxin-antitoxin system Phd/YefM family antitoxin [Rhodococcus sp. O3]|uniref:type II toxin-antitoxin system Phd/YefM family antitoxin n=1 Tax=Rhodococcus sp. O3 TaxID=3404919 RepID=UPI003B67EE58